MFKKGSRYDLVITPQKQKVGYFRSKSKQGRKLHFIKRYLQKLNYPERKTLFRNLSQQPKKNLKNLETYNITTTNQLTIDIIFQIRTYNSIIHKKQMQNKKILCSKTSKMI